MNDKKTQRAKVKIHSASHGQDYFLLVVKINAKGLLVNTQLSLSLLTPVKLELILADSAQTLTLTGVVHKFVTHPTGTVSTIVRFEGMDQHQEKDLSQFIEKLNNSGTQTPSQDALSRDRTQVVDSQTLSHLALENPSQKENELHQTVDEESLHSSSEGLMGKTMIIRLDSKSKDDIQKKYKKKFPIKWLVLFFLLIVLVFWLVNQNTSKDETTAQNILKPDAQFSPAIMSPTPVVTTQATPETSTETQEYEEVYYELTQITHQKIKNSVVVKLVGQEGILDYKINEKTKASKLHIDFENLDGFQNDELIQINKPPLFAVRTRLMEVGIRVTFEFYPKTFAKYTIENLDDQVKITFSK